MDTARLVLTLTAGLALGGCYAAGIKVDQQTLQQFQKGVAFCDEMVARFGPPTNSTLKGDGTREILYVYHQGQIKPESFVPVLGSFVRGSTTETTQAVLYCDARGVLMDYVHSQGQMEAGSGIVSGAKQR